MVMGTATKREQREQLKRRLKALRAGVDLTQMDVAAVLGITHNRYWQIEIGYEQPSETECNRLAKALRVKVEELGFSSSHQAVA